MNFSGTTTYFLETQQIFDDVKRVFHLGTNAGLDLLNLLQHLTPRRIRQRATFARSHGYMPNGRTPLLRSLLYTQYPASPKATLSCPCSRSWAWVTSLILAGVGTQRMRDA